MVYVLTYRLSYILSYENYIVEIRINILHSL